MNDGYVPAYSFILFRVIGATLLFWILGFFLPKEKIEKTDITKLVLCGLFGVAANQLMFFKGLEMTSTINASIIMTSNPVLVLALSAIILKERVGILKILGITIGLTGAVLLILNKGGTGDKLSSVEGDLLILMNASSYGLYLILAKPIMQKYSPLTVIKWVFTFGSIFVIPFGVSELSEVQWSMPADVILRVLFVVVFTTFFAYLFNIYGLSKVTATVASSFIYLQPILTTIIAISSGKETFSFEKGIFGFLIFAGVFLVIQRKFQIPLRSDKSVGKG